MKHIPLEEVSISKIYNGDKATYEIPVYQRNYAWTEDEIEALVRDVADANNKDPHSVYYIGTLVTFNKGEGVFEVIDGQQRLTTIYLILHALGKTPSNRLTYHSRRKSTSTIKNLDRLAENKRDIDEDVDEGIINGLKYAKRAIEMVVGAKDSESRANFSKYFLENVHLIHYQVPKDVDLNHYFEVMNSRGEQLEKHEIVKAKLVSILKDDKDDTGCARFTAIWDACSDMSTYIQQRMPSTEIFGPKLSDFNLENFDSFKIDATVEAKPLSLSSILANDADTSTAGSGKNEEEDRYTFQPIIDFSNFLLIVLKITIFNKLKFGEKETFVLDDKELLNEFEEAFRDKDSDMVKKFAFNLLKSKYLLDNYVVHHANEDDVSGNNPWQLQYWKKEADASGKVHGRPVNLANKTTLRDNENIGEPIDDEELNQEVSEKSYIMDLQLQLVHLLSMFEVSFTARQRKNYLFYMLLYLNKESRIPTPEVYCTFLKGLADEYLHNVYMQRENLNDINTPLPGAFDRKILLRTPKEREDARSPFAPLKQNVKQNVVDFNAIYGDGSDGKASRGIPLFIFNYLDYKIWDKYREELRGNKLKENSPERERFFKELGCGDFDLEPFKQFYFSRTRRSLEHFYPRANVNDKITDDNINCLGNYAMIGATANSAGSNWSPAQKLGYYHDDSQKISPVSVASLKFEIMMQICRDRRYDYPGSEWTYEQMKEHQEKMLGLLFDVR